MDELAAKAFFTVAFDKSFSWVGRRIKRKKKYSDDELKKLVNILFIDDEKFEYIDTVRDAGWNVQYLQDVSNLEDEHLKRSHIIFLDYVGVGKKLSPTGQGIGLLKAIKDRYPEKVVIFYSAHAGFSLGDEFRAADDWLPKNSEPYVYLLKILEWARKVEVK